jgi:hypothetical protein
MPTCSSQGAGKDQTKERLMTYSGFGDASLDALYKAYEEVSGLPQVITRQVERRCGD